jgi:RNA polymerase sigma factor (TIGR02999 family)
MTICPGEVTSTMASTMLGCGAQPSYAAMALMIRELTLSDEETRQCFPPDPKADGESRHQLFETLYAELRRIAQRELRRNGPAFTLSPTTLLHEAYMSMHARLGSQFPDRAHFLAYASRAMRGLIIDYARSRQALKRGGAFEVTSLPTDVPELAAESAELERVGDAVERLAAVDPRLAQVVDLKYFGGFSFAEIAAMWGMSERTVQRDWEKARVFLHRHLSDADGEPAS